MRIRRRNSRVMGWMIVVISATVLLLIGLNYRPLSTTGHADQALEAVEDFYHYEQAGDFGSAWELFHPIMQERFDKAAYIQKRAHIMLQDFGVKTFDVSFGKPTAISNWKMTATSEPIAKVYEVEVTETFHSPYGDFHLVQNSYVVDVEGTWKVLWSYQA